MSRFPALVALLGILVSPAAATPLPPALETGHLLGQGLPSGAPPVPLQDEFYALGWSPSNAFASLERRTLSEGKREVRFRVLDTVADTVLWEKTWEDWGPDGAQAAWWEAREPEVDAVFSRFGLAPTQRQLGQFPLIVDNEYFTLVLRPSAVPEQPPWVHRLDIVVHSTGRGLKTVGSLDGYWRWATILGFVPSPFENRLALVLLTQGVGWQGDLQPVRFQVLGLSLKAGFPKP